MDDIIDELQEEGILSLSSLLRLVFEKAKEDLKYVLKERKTDLINELEGMDEADEEYEFLNEEFLALDCLSPEEDITYYINYLDTHIYIDSDKEEVYRKYFNSELDDIEENMGYSFRSGCA